MSNPERVDTPDSDVDALLAALIDLNNATNNATISREDMNEARDRYIDTVNDLYERLDPLSANRVSREVRRQFTRMLVELRDLGPETFQNV